MQLKAGKQDVIALVLISIVHLIGLIGLNIESIRPIFEMLTPLNLLFTAGLVFRSHGKMNADFWMFAASVSTIGFLVELAGVHTKVIFGEYYYLGSLGPKLFDIPLMIAVNWLLLMYCTYVIASYVSSNVWLKTLITAGLMTGLDYFIEPFAIRHELWYWVDVEVPIRNYLAWFVISAVLAFSTHYFLRRITNAVAFGAFWIMLIFFVTDNAVNRIIQ